MNARRLSKFSALSFSMPDVTGAGFSNSPGYYAPAEDIVEEGEEEDEEREDSVPSANLWEDAVDPTTGSVFYVDSAPRPRPRYPNGSAIPPSTSSSSLSSSTSSQLPLSSSLATSPLPHHSFSMSLPPTPNYSSFTPPFPPPHSTTPSTPNHSLTPPFPPPHSATPQFTKRAYSTSEFPLPSPTLSENMLGFPERRVPPSPSPSPLPSEGWLSKSQSTSNMTSVGKSVKNKIRKFVKGGGRHSKSNIQSSTSSRMVPSGSFPNLSSEAELSTHPENQLPTTPHGYQQSPPHGALYGSGGFSLTPEAHTSIITVRISLRPRPPTIRPHRHWNLEKVGIIPARALGGKRYRSFSNLSFGFQNHQRAHSSSTNALVVRGILPGSPASFAPKLQPGDTILSVNGRQVDLHNANTTIRSLTDEELVLIIKKNSLHHSTLTSTPAHHHLYTSSRPSGITSLVSGKRSSHHHHSPPHLLLYLTLDTKEEDPANKDIIYCYPKDALATSDNGVEGRGGRGESTRSHLLQLRGVFLTLSDVMASITTENKSCSTVHVKGRSFNLAHIQCDKEVLLLALPASVLPRDLVLATAERMERVLQLLFGSPQRAFSCQDNHSTVDHLLTLLFHHLSYSHPHTPHLHPLSVSPLTNLTTIPRYNMVSVDATLCVSEALDVLEAVSPTQCMTDIAHAPRTLFPHGSFLFYQGQLVQSHLPHSELTDVVTFCQAYRLLEVSRQDPRTSIVIWRQIHLSGELSNLDDNTSSPIFLLIVGMDHMLVGLIMEGCGLSPETTPTLDPVYVDEAKQLIAKLDTQEIFSSPTNTGAAVATPIPAVISLDKVLTTHLSTPHQSPLVTSRSHRLSVPQFTSGQGSDTDEEDPPFTTRSNTLPSFLPRGKRGKWKHTSQEVIHPKPLPTEVALRQNYILTAGTDNILLHYLCVEAGQGVWLGPTHHNSSLYGTVHHEMITTFQTTCTAIRAILLGKTPDEEEESDDEWNGDSEEEDDNKDDQPSPLPPFSQPLPGGRCVEHGVLVDIPLKHFVTDKHLKTVPSLAYWVVGRMFPDTGRELYICYEDNTSQTTVEMAFKLLFGTSPAS